MLVQDVFLQQIVQNANQAQRLLALHAKLVLQQVEEQFVIALMEPSGLVSVALIVVLVVVSVHLQLLALNVSQIITLMELHVL